MAFCSIDDINLLIIKKLTHNFHAIVSLSFLNRASYEFITNTNLYREIEIMKENNLFYNIYDNTDFINLCCKSNLMNSLRCSLKYYKTTREFPFIVNDVVVSACEHANIVILKWLRKHNFEFGCLIDAIESTCKCGSVEILEWFRKSGYEFQYSTIAIDWASSYGHVQILDWFKKSDLVFKYSHKAIDWACKYGYIQILDWFKTSGLKFEYSENAIIFAAINGYKDTQTIIS